MSDSTRERILNAFEMLIIEHGERAATISAVAEAAAVSKGGLLYHFGSKQDLVAGLLQRFNDHAAAELDLYRESDDPIHAILSGSLELSCEFDRTYVAVWRLAQLEEHTGARTTLDDFEANSVAFFTDITGDRVLATMVVRLSDGLYLRAAITGAVADSPATVDRMAHILNRLTS